MNKTKLLILLGVISVLLPMGASEKVAVVGWDGADWRQIQPLLENGDMPNLEKIIEDGDRGNLSTVDPIMSPVAWSSYSTGSDPSKHGIYDFLQFKNGGFKPLTSRDIQQPYFWNQMEGESVVVNMPMTYPPKETEGALVGGYLSSNSTTYTYPSDLTEELNSKGYIIEALSEGYSPDDPDKTVKKSERAVEKRTETALDLYQDYNPEFFHVTYTGLDRLQHYFPLNNSEAENGNAVSEHYIKLDEELGKIQSELDENTTLIVMSDHGFQELETEIYLNHWMKKKGYLKLEKPDSLLGRLGITQQRVAPMMKRFGLLEPAKKVLNAVGFNPSEDVPQPGMGQIDMEKTKAYAGNYGGAVNIVEENVEDPETFRKDLREELEGLEVEGEKPFQEVAFSEEIYQDADSETPEILTIAKPGFHVVGFLGKGKLYAHETEKSGVHRKQGIIATDSNEFRLENANITDVAPTIMEKMNYQKPDHMTGRSLIE